MSIDIKNSVYFMIEKMKTEKTLDEMIDTFAT